MELGRKLHRLGHRVSLMVESPQSGFYRAIDWQFSVTHPDHFIGLPSGNIQSDTPILDAQRFTINRNPSIGGSVSSLSGHSRPTTIVWFIIPVVIDPVDRISFGRALSHIGKEVLELLPSLADLDASISIPMILCVIWIRAPIFHLGPDIPFSCATLSMEIGTLKAVGLQHLRAVLTRHATAAKLCLTEIGSGSNRRPSAVAMA